MNSIPHNEFLRLGRSISAARLALGMAKQTDLASALGVSQQTVSRWEAGIAKPNERQLQTLSVALKLNLSDLHRLAGRESATALSFVEPFPVDRLPPNTFEQFVCDLVKEENPEADVRRAGGTGHTQDGLDVEVVFPDGRRIGLQCKRVQRFGPAEAEAAITAFSADNYEKILVLSRIASPQTAEVFRSQTGWQLWDKDDLSRRVRHLPVNVQERLVDTYFRGQRQALLGRAESGPWVTLEDFFKPYEGPNVPLSHSWDMFGRESEVSEFQAALDRPGVRLITLIAAGGMGKSRLLKEAMTVFSQREPSVCIRFLSGAVDPTRQTLDDLGPGPKVLVIDDAHDRDGLGVLFEYAGDLSRQTRLVLATRNYAVDRILNEAANYSVISPPAITLGTLSRDQLRAIAKQILAHFKIDDEDLTRYVVAASGDSPMIVAMAAQVLAKDNIHVELAKNKEEFRRVVLGKFTKVVAGHVGNAGDEKLYRDVLNVLALVQPFHPEDQQLLSLLGQLQGIPKDVASAALTRFAQGGVIFRRGHQWRLMPDVLGDYLIETCCIDGAGRLSLFAEKALGTLRDTLLKHAVVNLGRLDWRRSAGDTANSDFLSAVWRTFDDVDSDYDPRLETIKSVALYQPHQALEFAVRQVRRKRALRALPEILNRIALTSGYLKEVMQLLWEIGRSDDRELGPNPSHPIRVLCELGSFDGRKPLSYCEALLEFGLGLADDEANWRGRYTPLDILKPLLSAEGTNNSSNGRTLTLAPYYINYEVVKPLRASVIGKIVALLRQPDVAVARKAGRSLSSAIRYPMGIMGSVPPSELRTALTEEFTATLEQVQTAIEQGVHPLAVLAVVRSISWHANYGAERPASIARQIFANLPEDIDFRVMAALTDGWGSTFVPHKTSEHRLEDLDGWHTSVAADLTALKSDPIERLAYLERALVSLNEAAEAHTSAHMLIRKLNEDEQFARALLEDALNRSSSQTRGYSGGALSYVIRESRDEGRRFARRMIEIGDPVLAIAVAQAYVGLELGDEDKKIIRILLSSENRNIVYHGIQAVSMGPASHSSQLIDLLLNANIGESTQLADEVAMGLCANHDEQRRRPVDVLVEEHVALLFERLSPIAALEGYWIDELLAELSYRYPYLTARFFMERTESATRRQSFSFRPANFGPYSQRRLRFLESNESLGVLQTVWHWLRQNVDRDYYFQHAAAHTFEAMFLGSTDKLVEFFRPMLSRAGVNDLKLMGKLLREADHKFVFDNRSFVIELLERCQTIDFEIHREIAEQLYCAAISGMRTGLPGEPMPRDLEDKQKAEDVLAGLSRLSPAYELFDWIRKSAIDHIDRAKLDAEGLDE